MKDDLDDLDPEIADLLSAYSAETARTPGQIEDALAHVSAKVGGSAAAAASAGMSTTAKVGLAATVVGIAGAVGLALAGPDPVAEPQVQTTVAATAEPTPKPQPEPRPEPAAMDDAPMAPPPISEPEPEPVERSAPPRSKRPEQPNEPTPEPAPADTLAEELRLLQQVRAALRRGETKRARTLMSEHHERFPSTAVARERMGTMIVLQCAEGSDDDAKRTAQAYNRRYAVPTDDLLAGCDD